MRYVTCSLVIGLAASMVACSDTSGPETTCGAGTYNVNGECVTLVTCGDGTTNVDNTCVPVEGTTCGAGTQAVDGLCVPSGALCETGTHLDSANGTCVPDFEVVCGAGTVLGPDGACVPSEIVQCGAGTTLVGNECVLIVGQCDAWEIWNPSTESCEPDPTTICGTGGTGGIGGAGGTGGGSGSCVEVDIQGEPNIMGPFSIFPESATFDDFVTVTVGVDGDTRKVTAILRNRSSDIIGGTGFATTSGNETVQVDVLIGTTADPGPHVVDLELWADPSDPLNYIRYTPGDGDTYVRIKVENDVPGPETATLCDLLNCNIEF